MQGLDAMLAQYPEMAVYLAVGIGSWIGGLKFRSSNSRAHASNATPTISAARADRRFRSPARLAVGLAVIVLLLPAPSLADHDVGQHAEEEAPPPKPPEQLLKRLIPGLEEAMRDLPPFLRDTDLNLRFRTFYFDRENTNDSLNEAWAIGGWLDYKSGWLADTFRIGAAGYTSQPLHAPGDHDGTKLLAPGQEQITALGQAYAQLRYKEYALLTGYRQLVDDGYVNPQDNRMIPNTFEGVTLKGAVEWVGYNVGYLWDMKPRDSNDFISMSRQAGATGDNEGLLLTSVTLTPWKPLNVFLANYYVPDVFNTGFGKATYTQPLTGDLTLQVGMQGTDQRSVGEDRIGAFATWNIGFGFRFLYQGLSVGLATHFTGDDFNIQSPYGSWPGYLSLIETDFDRAGEKAWGVGVRYDFGEKLLPFRVPGLGLYLAYAEGRDRQVPATGADLPTTREGDLDITYTVPGVKGLQLRFRNAYVDDGGQQVGYQFRFIINYDVDLL